jgi:aminobenzoyl-glutamate transport protein
VLVAEASTGTTPLQKRNRFLDGVERLGNVLPDPALIFVALIAVLMALSAVGAAAGWSTVNPRPRRNTEGDEPVVGTVAAVAHY